MFTDRKRILHLMIIGVLMNFILFSFAYYLNLPLWLDTTGTIYISVILGYPAGFIAAIVNNLTQSALFYGEQSLCFYFVSLITAYISGTIMLKYKHRRAFKWLLLTAALTVFEGIAAIFITFITTMGIPVNTWSADIYNYFLNQGINHALAASVSILAIKIPDVICTNIIVFAAIRLTPKKLKSADIAVAR